MTNKKPTTDQRLAELERLVDVQRQRISHLEDLYRLQQMPIFWDKYIVDLEGPLIEPPPQVEGEDPKCFLCPHQIAPNEQYYKLLVRRHKELLDCTIHNRIAFVHAGCMIRATRVQGDYFILDGEIFREP